MTRLVPSEQNFCEKYLILMIAGCNGRNRSNRHDSHQSSCRQQDQRRDPWQFRNQDYSFDIAREKPGKCSVTFLSRQGRPMKFCYDRERTAIPSGTRPVSCLYSLEMKE